MKLRISRPIEKTEAFNYMTYAALFGTERAIQHVQAAAPEIERQVCYLIGLYLEFREDAGLDGRVDNQAADRAWAVFEAEFFHVRVA